MGKQVSSRRFNTGDRVRIRTSCPIGHCRTPFYTRGHEGVIERCCGSFPNPEELAYGRDGQPAVPLYRVRVAMRDLWSDDSSRTHDTLEVEIFEHWLTFADQNTRAQS